MSVTAEGTITDVEAQVVAAALELDLISRDPNDINNHLGVTFEEIFAEPDGAHSLDCVWKCTYKCFNMWKGLCYIIATTLTSIILASCWACSFACTAYSHIWIVVPCFKLCDMNVACVKKFYGMCIHCVCDPCCEAVSIVFQAFSPTAQKLLNAF